MSIDTDPMSIDTELGSSLRLAETLICIDTKVYVSIHIDKYRYLEFSIDIACINGNFFELCIDTIGIVSIL